MNRNQAKELFPIIKAFAEGRTIQYRINGNESAIWEECGAYIHIVSETIVAVCDGKFFPCVFKDSEDILATDWEEVEG